MQKETFILRTEWYEAISELDPKDQATIFKNLFLYHLGDINDVVLDTFAVKIVWKLIEPTLSRNIESYDKRKITSVENGQKGGRKTNAEKENQKQPNNNLNNLNDNLGLPQKPIESLSVSDSVYDSVSVSESESVPAAETPTLTELKALFPDKDFSEFILTAPGTDQNNQLFYEKIMMSHSWDLKKITNVHTKWIPSRKGKLFTLREARQDFEGFCASWANNDITSGRSSPSPQYQDAKQVTSSYLS